MEPQKFGRYEIKAEIGRGGMATVYHAYDPRFEREVAIKVLPREMLHDPQFRARFEREARTVAMLEHPAIVPVYDYGEEDGQPYFVMRYMTGGSLSERIRKGPLSIQEAAHLFQRLAPALDTAHAKGIIHRDLKPGNILFDQYGEPYISDFGIAKLSESQASLTGSAIVGTPAYMSPEQAQGEGGIDGRSDIYGLGVILFEVLTGQQPYQGDTPMSVVLKHVIEPVPHILDVKPDLPVSTEAVTEKAMAKDRDQRFGTVAALAEALSAIARGETPDLNPEASTTRISASKSATAQHLPGPLPETMIAKRPMQPDGGAQAQGPRAKRKHGGLWIGLGIAGLLLCGATFAGLFLFKDRIPFLAFLAAPTPTRTLSQASPTFTLETTTGLPTSTLTETPGVILPPPPTDTITPSTTPTITPEPSLGGADLIAFMSDNDIYLLGVDGTGLRQLTKDGTAKQGLQWAPDGQSVFYISGKCIQSVSLTGEVITITCFPAVENLDAFEISPDGTQVAISLNRTVYVVPFDLAAISNAHNWMQVRDMKACPVYDKDIPMIGAFAKRVRWSNDSKKLAVEIIGVGDAGLQVDSIRVLDIFDCIQPRMLDTFPEKRFPMTGYNKNPVIPSFDWDGEMLFLLNSVFRFEYGYLYAYNYEKRQGEPINPLGSPCCYGGARWSPDGSYMLFTFQDISAGESAKTQLYYVLYGTIGTGATYQPFDLPADLFTNPRNYPEAALRPVKP